MIFTETKLPGAYLLALEKREDERGFFARTWCQQEFADHGLVTCMVQGNVSYNRQAGTLRGLHYQMAPYGEVKVVRCTRGALYDVIVDLRVASPTYKEWLGVELTADNYQMLYVPAGCAHGFITLAPDTEATYQVSQFYTPGAEGGLRYDDPAFVIEWPAPVQVISAKDKSWPNFVV
jgi:dTDP-4-dehydrorhamnose 3,5-epimerase